MLVNASRCRDRPEKRSMLPFIRSDLAQLNAYTPHPGGTEVEPAHAEALLDRLDTNESPYDLPDELKQKLAGIYQHNIETNRYPDGVHTTLKQAIAEYVTESTISLTIPHFPNLEKFKIIPENVSVGNGSDELIRSLLIATCLGQSGAILVANPTFSMYRILAETLGIPVISVNRSQTNFEIDIAAAQSAIKNTTNPPVRVVFVVHPNSPTANALTAAELEWLRNIPENILVVIDEAYFEFSKTTVAGELLQHPNWVILRTFSKAFRLAALRVGYAIAHPQLISTLEKIRLPYNLPSFSQAAALLALTHRQELLASISETIQERSHLLNALSQHSALQVWPSDANFIYLRFNKPTDNVLTSIAQQLKANGTLVRQISDGLRITIGTPAENARTLSRLLAVIDANS